MKIEELQEAVRVLSEVSSNLRGLPECRVDASCESLQMESVCMLLTDLAKHLVDGLDPYDALIKAVIGDTEVGRKETLTMLSLMTAKPTKD